MAKSKPKRPNPRLPPREKIEEVVRYAINEHAGLLPTLESAIGMYFIGYAFGWRILYMIHSVSTIRKYEKILGIVAKDLFPETTEHSDRSYAFDALQRVSNFWKAVKGENTPEGFRNPEIKAAQS